jgi:hypothetical protein
MQMIWPFFGFLKRPVLEKSEQNLQYPLKIFKNVQFLDLASGNSDIQCFISIFNEANLLSYQILK